MGKDLIGLWSPWHQSGGNQCSFLLSNTIVVKTRVKTFKKIKSVNELKNENLPGCKNAGQLAVPCQNINNRGNFHFELESLLLVQNNKKILLCWWIFELTFSSASRPSAACLSSTASLLSWFILTCNWSWGRIHINYISTLKN